MFFIATIFFVIFTAGYALAAAAVIYHLRQYTLPGHKGPQTAISIFIFLSFFFWLLALYFLFTLPR